MIIVEKFVSDIAQIILDHQPNAVKAYNEVIEAIEGDTTQGKLFIINNSKRHINGVRPVKHHIIDSLSNNFGWSTEHKLYFLSQDMHKGGPIDAYKVFGNGDIKAGLEFETGYVGSVHRSINKMMIGIDTGNLNLCFLVLPTKNMSQWLTDRCANYEEIKPYLMLWNSKPLIVLAFEADGYDPNAPILPKTAYSYNE